MILHRNSITVFVLVISRVNTEEKMLLNSDRKNSGYAQ